MRHGFNTNGVNIGMKPFKQRNQVCQEVNPMDHRHPASYLCHIPIVLDLGKLVPLRQASELSCLCPHGEGVPILKLEELIQVEQGVEKDP